MEISPERTSYLNTMGVALYRSALYKEAVPILERSLTASKGQSDAFDLFFLAMAHHRLGHPERARADLDRALLWRREHSQQTTQSTNELNAFQTEAEKLLASHPGELPADIFAPDAGP